MKVWNWGEGVDDILFSLDKNDNEPHVKAKCEGEGENRIAAADNGPIFQPIGPVEDRCRPVQGFLGDVRGLAGDEICIPVADCDGLGPNCHPNLEACNNAQFNPLPPGGDGGDGGVPPVVVVGSSSSSGCGPDDFVYGVRIGQLNYTFCCPEDRPNVRRRISSATIPCDFDSVLDVVVSGVRYCYGCEEAGGGGGGGGSSASSVDEYYCVVVQSPLDCDALCREFFGEQYSGGEILPGLCECIRFVDLLSLDGSDSSVSWPSRLLSFLGSLSSGSPVCVSGSELDYSIHMVLGGPYSASECDVSCGAEISSSSSEEASSSSSESFSSSSSSSSEVSGEGGEDNVYCIIVVEEETETSGLSQLGEFEFVAQDLFVLSRNPVCILESSLDITRHVILGGPYSSEECIENCFASSSSSGSSSSSKSSSSSESSSSSKSSSSSESSSSSKSSSSSESSSSSKSSSSSESSGSSGSSGDGGDGGFPGDPSSGSEEPSSSASGDGGDGGFPGDSSSGSEESSSGSEESSSGSEESSSSAGGGGFPGDSSSSAGGGGFPGDSSSSSSSEESSSSSEEFYSELVVSVLTVLDSNPELPGLYYGEDAENGWICVSGEVLEFRFAALGSDGLPYAADVYIGGELVANITYPPAYEGGDLCVVRAGFWYCGVISEGGVYL